MKHAILILGLLSFSCSSSQDSPKPKSGASQNDANKKVSSSKLELGAFRYTIASDSLVTGSEITSLTYDAAKHSLNVGLDYKGCNEVSHSLLFADFCAESYPRQCGAAVIRSASYDGSCADSHHQDLSVTLSEAQDEMVLTVTNKDAKSRQVLIDKTGRVKAATTPPQ